MDTKLKKVIEENNFLISSVGEKGELEAPVKNEEVKASVKNEEVKASVKNEEVKAPVKISTETVSVPAEVVTGKVEDPVSTEIVRPEDEDRKLHQKTRFNGAQRKRFKWLLAQGKSREEARVLSEIHISPKRPRKKIRYFDLSSKERPIKRMRMAHTSSASYALRFPPTVPVSLLFNEAVSKNSTIVGVREERRNIRVGILHCNYPEALLSEGQMDEVQDAIELRIIENVEENSIARFKMVQRKLGFLVLTCADETAEDWLRKVVPQLMIGDTACLKLVSEVEIPQARVAMAFFPNSQLLSDDQILKYLRIQNKELCVQEWKVLRRTEEGKESLLTLLVDDASAKKLSNSCPWVHYKLGQVQIKLKLKGNEISHRKRSAERAGIWKAEIKEEAPQITNRHLSGSLSKADKEF